MSATTLEKSAKLSRVVEGLAASYNGTRGDASAREALSGMDFPTTRVEAWKYTRLGQLPNKAWRFAANADFDESMPLPISLEDLPLRMVFVNGHFAERLSQLDGLAEGLSIRPWSQAETDFAEAANPSATAFSALNAAYPQDGVAIHLAKNTAVDEPLSLVNIYSGEEVAGQPRNSIHVERGSSLKITEFHIHLGSTFANTATEIRLDDNAQLGIDVLQMGSAESFHMQEVNTVLGRDTVFTHNNFTLSGKWTRNNTNARITGQGSTCNMHGFYLPRERELVDNHTIMDHKVAHCDSNELYRGVLLDQSVGVFNGKVFVRQDAQKTNAFQSNGNILASDQATMNSKPELEIYADDVKCSHGSTTGQLDDAAMFYLRARGLSAKSARRMLVTAFAADVLEKMVNQNMRSLVETNIEERLK